MISLCRCMVLFSFFKYQNRYNSPDDYFFLIMTKMICALSRASYTAYKKKERKKERKKEMKERKKERKKILATRVYS